ncbi:nucleotide exchange factor GrpE [candidate division WWE3 bacterium RIFOXYC1_FULL_40_10]|uniref:Protein GrpE n=1 Tax=candidate division WWE3 bacterium RIFOXYA2_FULL_46_9 TaxID=1802636 RepID=A0A1F4W0X7_UNCKA|nr:MAG: nucleotide exchange factor GrpE [candidate division WWE3 bacterium RIFOXYB1_FULL_40_22]OGC62067.1 MAG: nucleotide exchange factor GrpE [candidate division WWE3 bacterium RIFOXYA1_FULL_40_11]OGC63082.1 MAG: nucleotide exchange factor GrpE [candidate division WWE3 bacterium RIFOXYA2_FULL_46_9]OGC64988.1 MAG: nucleotide exchange factor GrpE [candidate division WWE3 bacterium RIFOXYB2_FULL_41_6]OGC66450.1 MAG: nucleotide exchange factor GrpE [candidate division WWE3 bacterium RIFOXYC1_FULL_
MDDSSQPKADNNIENQLREVETKLVEMENNWKRALADYKNLEKRVIEEKEYILKTAGVAIIAQLLPVMDNLEMVSKHCDDTGLKITVKDFKGIFGELGVEEINPIEQHFSSDTMDAIETVEGEKDKVIEVLRKGYKINGNLIRPAGVKVGKGK